jgi:hypothetical protein
MDENDTRTEEFKVNGKDLVNKVKEIIQEGNARRLIIKNEDGISILEIPLTIGVVGVLLTPYVAAVGAVAAFVTSCSIVVEKRSPSKPQKKEKEKKEVKAENE